MKEVLEQLQQMGARIGEQLDQMNGRFDQIDGRFAQVDARFEQVDRRFEQVDRRFDQVDRRFDQVGGRLDQVDNRLERVEGQLQKQGVLLEAVSADVKMALEGIAGNREVMDKRFTEMAEKLDERVQPIEHASRHFARTLAAPGGKSQPRKKQI